jgi:hypothetical protein
MRSKISKTLCKKLELICSKRGFKQVPSVT